MKLMCNAILCLCLALFTIPAMASPEPLRFTQLVSKPKLTIGAQILLVAYAKLNIPIQIVYISGQRALIESSEGRFDGEVQRIYSIGNRYPTLLRVPTPINYVEATVFAKKPGFKHQGCDSLKGLHIGRVRGVIYAQECTRGMVNVAVMENSTILMRTLDKGIVDIVIAGRINGLTQLKKLGFSSIMALKPPLSKSLLYHYLHQKHQHLIGKIDRVLKQMQADGELETLRRQFVEQRLAIKN
jgi:polar amino acid transport system substrate-binding protein